MQAQGVTDEALNQRLRFIKLDASGSEQIRSLRPIIARHLAQGLDRFYDQVRATEAVRRLFTGEDHIAAAKKAQLKHWDAIAAGDFSSHYGAAVRSIGRTHARIGLEPQWYIGGYALIVEHLISSVIEEVWPKTLFRRRKSSASRRIGAALGLLIKAVFLDMELAVSNYIDASAEAQAKLTAERDRVAAERNHAIERLAAALEKLAAKDLSSRIDEDMPEGFVRLKTDFNSAVDLLSAAFKDVSVSASGVRASAQEIATASNDLSRRAEQQASSLEETAAALNEITAAANGTAEGARHANEVVGIARSDAQQSIEIVRQAIDAMGKIEKSSSQIGQIIGVIDEIAFQTNLLALNAGVEAARAGDAGRGFAVVASEVRALAQRSAEAAREIKGLIHASTTHVSEGVALVGKTGAALERIETKVSEIDEVVARIASGVKEQASGLGEINGAVNQMDQVTQHNAALAEQMTGESHTLSNESGKLTDLIGQFSFEGLAGDALRRELKVVAPHAFVERAARPSTNSMLRGVEVQPDASRSSDPAKFEATRPPQSARMKAANDAWEEF